MSEQWNSDGDDIFENDILMTESEAEWSYWFQTWSKKNWLKKPGRTLMMDENWLYASGLFETQALHYVTCKRKKADIENREFVKIP